MSLEKGERRTALVTGASSGIGLAFAQALAADGWSLVLVARREQRLKDIVARLPGGGHAYVVADIGSQEGIDAVVKQLAEAPPRLLINNAGVVTHGPFHESPPERQREMMRVNMDALVAFSGAFLRGAASGDALVNVASVVGMAPLPYDAVYAATKSFVLSFSEALWYEQKDRGVYVMAVCPGATSSELIAVSGGKEPPASVTQTPEQVVSEAMAGVRLRKRPSLVTGRVNRITALVTRLLSRRAVVGMMGGVARKAQAH